MVTLSYNFSEVKKSFACIANEMHFLSFIDENNFLEQLMRKFMAGNYAPGCCALTVLIFTKKDLPVAPLTLITSLIVGTS